MTTETTESPEVAPAAADAAHEAHHDEAHADHPTPAQYWLIALVLAVVTAVEVAVAYIDALDPVIAPLLFILGGIKFGMVVALFMHLKFERPLYKMLFLIGLAGALAMFVVVLLTFQAI